MISLPNSNTNVWELCDIREGVLKAQNMCYNEQDLINVNISICQHAKCDCRLWKALKTSFKKISVHIFVLGRPPKGFRRGNSSNF